MQAADRPDPGFPGGGSPEMGVETASEVIGDVTRVADERCRQPTCAGLAKIRCSERAARRVLHVALVALLRCFFYSMNFKSFCGTTLLILVDRLLYRKKNI